MGTTQSSSQVTIFSKKKKKKKVLWLQWSIRSEREVKENEAKARIQSSKYLKNNSLRLGVIHSQPSNLLWFLFHQIHHLPVHNKTLLSKRLCSDGV